MGANSWLESYKILYHIKSHLYSTFFINLTVWSMNDSIQASPGKLNRKKRHTMIFKFYHRFETSYEMLLHEQDYAITMSYKAQSYMYLGRNSVIIERCGGRVTAPIKSTTFGWRNLRIIRT